MLDVRPRAPFVANDLNLQFIDWSGARNNRRARRPAVQIQTLGLHGTALRARTQDRTARLAWPLTTTIQAGLQNVAAKTADDLARLYTKQSRCLRIQITNHARLIDRVHAFDNTAQHSLGLRFASPQCAGELDQIVAHVFHRARELADFLRAADRDRGGEITVTQPFRCVGERRDRTRHLLS